MRILLADSQGRGRVALRRLLEQDPEFIVVGEAADAKGLLSQAEVTHPDLVLLDCELPGLQVVDLLPIASLLQFGSCVNLFSPVGLSLSPYDGETSRKVMERNTTTNSE